MRLLGIAAMVLLFGAANALGGNYDGKPERGMTYMQIVQLIGEEGEKIEDYMSTSTSGSRFTAGEKRSGGFITED